MSNSPSVNNDVLPNLDLGATGLNSYDSELLSMFDGGTGIH